ncbi:uncharacterized protein LOC117187039 [Drosophila miranda]|uniref:uncharacterized protein LOC117187039 n=1 Tax=Drosophila miranda TaxID=7229 RepID=UPI00143F850D|nr:uncharacterized protein LOC117187039 [Drosophila miranda]
MGWKRKPVSGQKCASASAEASNGSRDVDPVAFSLADPPLGGWIPFLGLGIGIAIVSEMERKAFSREEHQNLLINMTEHKGGHERMSCRLSLNLRRFSSLLRSDLPSVSVSRVNELLGQVANFSCHHERHRRADFNNMEQHRFVHSEDCQIR